ncbi:MAG: hypothetical protein E6J34_22100 [Chloroflexi bacterium]|nr:MAG: hypothetical protein E6J34_22100 [Chloroflexota bacterium]
MRNRWMYPDNWGQLAWECKERAKWCCQCCALAHGAWVVSRRGVPYRAYLAAAHLDHDPWNPHPRLAALCPRCHARYDRSLSEWDSWLILERLRHHCLVKAYKQRVSAEV